MVPKGFVMTSQADRHAHIVGLGLIGGSAALALQSQGWLTTGSDTNPETELRALKLGVISGSTASPATSLIFICTPAGHVVKVAQELLSQFNSTDLVVTDVAGVKGSISSQIVDPRFIGGHPMAGSEMRGVEGSRANLFTGCTWVLTPSATTSPDNYAKLHGVLRGMGASVMALEANDHDRMVAMASHVPHLVAGALMNEASQMAQSDGALLRLAAGGFRDMTRISAGDPVIWPDILFENEMAVLAGLDRLQSRIADLTNTVREKNREALLASLSSAAEARRRLPGSATLSENLVEVRIPVPDRPGVLAEITTLASELQINIFDIEIAHSVEGSPGVLLLSLEGNQASVLLEALGLRGFSAGVGAL
ncbi:MAG: prephenate dehydrogenase/arogenate dehydrogenase family protein [Actinobacteria bacterium]|nr:prephenate dehydrogenase/arogenate dehydrogenase family protein [Actinomycetota bacterium]